MKSKKNSLGIVKLIVSVVIVFLFIWFLVISPITTFHSNENKMRDAAKRYLEINRSEAPTGERVKTLSLGSLYDKKFLDGDFYVPYTHTLCDQTDSWVKIKRNSSGDYDYLVYLDCGVLQSSVDHKGPTIKLNGESEMTLGVGDKFTDPGVNSVVDNSDGKMKLSDVTIKGRVDTSKVGTYTIEYIAFDKLKNKTTVTREVKVVKRIRNVVKKDLGKATNYVGNPTNNYVRLSNMMFRIYGINTDGDIIVVAAEDISNVNFTKLDKWLNGYFLEHLNDKTKDMIVKNKYCNMNVTDSSFDTTECVAYTSKVNVYVPSVVEINRAKGDGNFMLPDTISWTADGGDRSQAYVTRNAFVSTEANFMSVSKSDNYGVRPMFTIKGTSNITGGDGTIDNPYVFGDSKKVEGGSSVGDAEVGQFISISHALYRIVDTKNGVKVIGLDSVLNGDERVEFGSEDANKITYDPTNKRSVGYFINNRIDDFVDSSNFEVHNIEVPIYKNKITYGEETTTKKYKVKLFAPNMYEMFSAQSNLYGHNSHSYWLINTSNGKRVAGVISDTGVVLNEDIPLYSNYGIRVCAYLKKNSVITSGSGTYSDPYIIK